jgi:hypothetical protein
MSRASVWVLFSGDGIYVEILHEISKPKSSKPGDRAAFFEDLNKTIQQAHRA